MDTYSQGLVELVTLSQAKSLIACLAHEQSILLGTARK
jgi:hypothetical protein